MKINYMSAHLCLLIYVLNTLIYHSINGYEVKPEDVKYLYNLVNDIKIKPSVSKWQFIETPKRISILTVSVDHSKDSTWYLPSLHDKYSIGWNRTLSKPYLNKPYACTIRFFGVGLADTLDGLHDGGTGYIIFVKADNKFIWHGADKYNNETNKIHCYYITNKGYGSNFFDTPKTYGVAINCPIMLDHEIGEYLHQSSMTKGSFCRLLSEKVVNIELYLRPSNFTPPPWNKNLPFDDPTEVIGEFQTNPLSDRIEMIKQNWLTRSGMSKPHAVCTVQTFRNEMTGPMLYLFISYYIRLGWSVIVYDRFGLHREFIEELLALTDFYYHPYTIYQLAQPTKYNKEYLSHLNFDLKYYYDMEKNWRPGFGSEKADTADQDMDKTRTYDYSRIEYSMMETMLYLDADEFLFCPEKSKSFKDQFIYQRELHDRFVGLGIQEMRYSRIPYAGKADKNITNNAEFRSSVDLTNSTTLCMNTAFKLRSEQAMFNCWSNASCYDDFPKSADLAGACPFHYNHWSCDGMRGGGRDYGHRCRCKVGFDMINHLVYKPVLDRCHLLHFNDNKYRFQLTRAHGKKGKKNHHKAYIFEHDNGDITHPCPIASLYSNIIDGESTNTFVHFSKFGNSSNNLII